ncbi:MAG: hypothetical protein U9N86_08825 [Bacteroidota bacterium]|nr:hypothetical protein [Bacteroidota bacterium]
MKNKYKKLAQIILSLGVFIALQSFIGNDVLSETSATPAPTGTTIRITNIPNDPSPYAIKVMVSGPDYFDQLSTVQSQDQIAVGPGTTEYFLCTEKFYYSASSAHTNCWVYTKVNSNSSWVSRGGINTDEGSVTKTVDGTFLTQMSFSWYSLDNP